MAMRHTWLLAGALTLAGLMVGPPAAASAVDGGTAATAVSPALSAAFTTGDEAARGGALRELLRIGSTEAVRLVVSRAPEQTPAPHVPPPQHGEPSPPQPRQVPAEHTLPASHRVASQHG